MVKIKQLKQHDEIFYPVTVGQAVIFEDDGTNADISEPMMDLIFDWSRNYISLTSTDETDNYIVLGHTNGESKTITES